MATDIASCVSSHGPLNSPTRGSDDMGAQCCCALTCRWRPRRSGHGALDERSRVAVGAEWCWAQQSPQQGRTIRAAVVKNVSPSPRHSTLSFWPVPFNMHLQLRAVQRTNTPNVERGKTLGATPDMLMMSSARRPTWGLKSNQVIVPPHLTRLYQAPRRISSLDAALPA